MYVTGIMSRELEKHWDRAKPFLQEIADLNGRYDLASVKEEILAAQWQLWLIEDGITLGALLTTIVSYPLQRDLQIIGLAGKKMESWLHLLKDIEQFGRNTGCHAIVVPHGRRGFEKVLKDYDKKNIVLEKAL